MQGQRGRIPIPTGLGSESGFDKSGRRPTRPRDIKRTPCTKEFHQSRRKQLPHRIQTRTGQSRPEERKAMRPSAPECSRLKAGPRRLRRLSERGRARPAIKERGRTRPKTSLKSSVCGETQIPPQRNRRDKGEQPQDWHRCDHRGARRQRRRRGPPQDPASRARRTPHRRPQEADPD